MYSISKALKAVVYTNLLSINPLLYVMAVKIYCRNELTEVNYRCKSAKGNHGCSVIRGSGPYPQGKDVQHLPL